MKVSVPEYAASEGITRQTAHERLRRIGLRVPRGGKIDPAVINAKLARTRDAVQAARNPSGKAKSAPAATHVEPRVVAEPRVEPKPPRDTSLSEAQRAKEWLSVEEKRIKLEREKGKLVDVAGVAEEWGRMISAARSMALLMPDKLAPKLAAIVDVRECRQIIAAEINALLTSLSEYRPNE